MTTLNNLTSNYTHMLTLRGTHRPSITLQISVTLTCGRYYYGNQCEVYCVNSSNDITGFYTCDSEGNIVCRPGYEDIETNCTIRKCIHTCTCTCIPHMYMYIQLYTSYFT